MAKSKSKKRAIEDVEDVEDVSNVPQDAAEKTAERPSKKSRVDATRSLFVRLLPATATSESLTNFFSQHYPVKHSTVVIDPRTKESRGYGFVTFADPEDAVDALAKLNNELIGGRRIRLERAEARTRDVTKPGTSDIQSKVAEEKRKRQEDLIEARKAPKLIVRNLPWSIKKSEQLEALFQPYGKVKYTDLPQSKGKLAGFGFVTLRGKKNAEKAMEGVNGKVVDGRTLAVDWAVDKRTWEEQNEAESSKLAVKKPEGDAKVGRGSDEEDEDEEKEKEEDEEDEDADIANFMKNHMENLEDEDSDAEEDKDKDDEGDEEEAEEEDDEATAAKTKRTTDNTNTLFIRNLPFSTTDEQLKTHFAQFGPVRYARTVMDRATERPAGTGFVCFFTVEDSKTCLKGAPRHVPAPTLSKHSVLQDETVDKDGRYTLDGRVLQVAQAVSKDEATRLASEGLAGKRAQERDKRRLFLLSEGSISASSPLYALLTPAEIKIRETSARQRKKQIESNPSLHLSLTRLALRNLPRKIDSKELKSLARQGIVGFAKDVKEGRRQPLSKEELARGGQQEKEAEYRRKLKGKGVVTQAKVIFETKEGSKVGDESAAGRSRGYGFIEYSSHRSALMGLRWLNGHAVKNEAGKTQRLIVEFAIENAQVVQRRKAMEDKTKQRAAAKEEEAAEAARGRKNSKKANKQTEAGPDDAGGDAEGPAGRSKDAEGKLALRTKIIVRKRMMRKKKATVRKGK